MLLLQLALVWGLAAAQLPRYPPHHTHECNDSVTQALPYCDTTLSTADRVADLISRLTLPQKVAARYDLEPAADGLLNYTFNWNQEGLHGLGAQCFAASPTSGVRCPTVFAAPPGLGAAFNLSLLTAIGDAIGTEARAYNNFGGNRGYENRPVDLNVWLPSINIGRDARWGRQMETYAEDPWYVGQLGAAIVSGTQQGADGGASGAGYLKMIVAAKHATAYQVEENRFDRNFNITQHDLSDTFYPAWEGVVEEGKAAGFMCAYSSINGVPSCGSSLLLTTLMKETWGLGRAWGGGSYVQGDCGAMENLYRTYHYASSMDMAAAMALNAGGDVDCGSALPGNLAAAIAQGLTTESMLDASLTRTYTLQFLAGRFDPPQLQPYMAIPFEAIDSSSHRALAYESGVQGLVLLRNDAALLPLAPAAQQRLAVIGPHGNTTGDLMGNYFEQRCAGGGFDCVPSLLSALQAAGVSAAFSLGCPTNANTTAGFPAALAVAGAADVVVLALGLDGGSAGEGKDRANALLPGAQAALAAAILALNKPTVVLLFNGAGLAIDDLVAARSSSSAQQQQPPLAILEAFYPGQSGGVPVVDTLFGRANRFGKLPVTLYPAAYYEALAIDQMSMVPIANVTPGRSYKYYAGPVLYPFGFGLSYTTFSLAGDCPGTGGTGAGAAAPPPLHHWALAAGTPRAALLAGAVPGGNTSCSITVKNTGAVAGDEVVLVYVTPTPATAAAAALRGDPMAIKRLVAFQRVSLGAGQSVVLPFSFSPTALAEVDGSGRRVVWPGEYELSASRGHGAEVAWRVRVSVQGGDRVVVREYPRL